MAIDDSRGDSALDPIEASNDPAFRAQATAAVANPSNEAAWDALEQWAGDTQEPDAVSAVYRAVLAKKLAEDLASELGQRALRFHEEWFAEDSPQVLEVLEHVLAHDAGAEWAFQRLSVVYTSRERWPELLATYDRAIERARDDGRREQLLEEAFQAARDFAKDPVASIRYLEKLVAEKPRDAALASSLEKLLERNERWPDLVEFLKAQLAARPESERAATRLRIFELSLEKLGDTASALAEAKVILAAPGDASTVVSALERIVADESIDGAIRRDASLALRARYERDGRTADLVRLLGAEIDLVDSRGRNALRVEAAERLFSNGDADGALDHLAHALSAAPEDATIRARARAIAEASQREGRLVRILADLADGLSDSGLRASYRIEAARLYRGALRDSAAAIFLFALVLEEEGLAADVALETARELAELYGATGRAAERLEMLERLGVLEQDGTRRRRLFGDTARLASELGLPDRALAAWENRLALDPADHEATEAIIAILEREERWDALASALRRRISRAATAYERRADLVRIARIESERLGRTADSIRTWLDVANEFGEDGEVVDALSTHYTAESRYADLAELLSRAEQNEGVHLAAVRARLGDTYREHLARPDLAARAYRRALEADAKHDASRAGLAALAEEPTLRAEAIEALARSYATTGEWAPELALLEARLDAASDDNTRVRLLREAAAIEEHSAGAPETALRSVVRAFAMAPTDLGLEAEIDRLATQTNQVALAVEGFHAAAAAVTGDPERQATLYAREAELAENTLHDPARAFDAYVSALRHRPRSAPLAEAVVRTAAATGALDTAEAVLVEIAADDAVPVRILELVADLVRRHPDAALVAVLERIAERRPTDLDPLVEAAGTAAAGATDAAHVTSLLERAFERAAGLLRRAEAASGSRTAVEVATATLTALLERHSAAGSAPKVLALAMEGARLPLERGVLVDLRRRAAKTALELGDRATAVELYREVLRFEPSDTASFLGLGELLEAEGRLGELLSLRKQELERATDRERRLALRLSIAHLVAEIERTGGRVEALLANLEEAPGHVSSIEALSDVLTRTSRFRELADVLSKQARAVEPAHSAELSRRVAHLATEELDDAELALASYRRVVEVAPDAEAFEALARLHEGRGESSQAARWLERRLTLAGAEDWTPVALRLSRLLFDAERADRAVEVLEEVRRREPANAEARARLVDEYRRAGALRALGAVLWETSEFVSDVEERRAAVREAATIYADKLGRAADAIPMLAKAVELSPDDRALRLELAEAYRVGERLADARQVLETTIEEFGRRRSPERAAVHFLLGRTLNEAGDVEGALAQVDLATQMAMTNAPMLLELGRLARAAGQVDRAEKAYRTLLVLVRRRGPDEVVEVGVGEVLYELAVIAGARGEADKEQELVESALEAVAGSDAEALRFAEALAGRGAGELALRGLERRLASVEGTARVPLLRSLVRVLDGTLARPAEALDRAIEALTLAPFDSEARAEARDVARRANAPAKLADALARVLASLRREEDETHVADLVFSQAEIVEQDVGDLASARTLYERVERLEQGGRVTEAVRALARVASLRGDVAEELRAVEKLISLAGTARSARVDSLYRLSELESRDPARAAAGTAHLREAFALDARFDRAATILADLAARSTLDDETARFYEEVARGSGDDGVLLEFLTLRAGRPDASLAQVREALERATAAGRTELVERFLVRAAEVAETVGPEEARAALVALADRREAAGEVAEALSLLERAIAHASGEVRRDLRLRIAALATRDGGDVRAAARAYRDLFDEEPSNPAVHLPFLRVLAAAGEEDAMNDAVASLVDSLEQPSARTAVRLEKARFLAAREGREYDAIDVLKAALEDEPAASETSSMLASLYERSGYDEDLVGLLRQQLDLARDREDLPQIATIATRLGGLLEKVDRADAMDVYRSALEWVRDERTIVARLLDLLGPEDDLRERAELRERLIATEPSETATRLALSVAAEWEAMSDEGGALRALAAGHRRNPGDNVLRGKLEQTYRDRGDDESLAAFLVTDANGLLDRPEQRRSRLLEAATVYRDRLGRPSDAARVLREAARGSMDLETLDGLVACLEVAGEHALAIGDVDEAFDSLAGDDATRARLLVLRARPLTALGHVAEALRDLEEAYGLDRRVSEAALAATLARGLGDAQAASDIEAERQLTFRLVAVLEAAGERTQARDVLAEYVRRAPTDVDALVRLRDVDLASENWDGVRESAELLVAATDGEARIAATLLFADACEQTAQVDRARLVLEQVLAATAEPRILARLRTVYESLGLYRELAQSLLEEATSAPADRKFELSSEAGRLLIERVGDAAAAIVPLEHAHAAKPDDHRTTLALVDAYTTGQRYAEAGQLLEAAIAAHPKRRTPELSQLQHRMARLARAADDKSLDYQWMSAALECDKNNVEVAGELAYLAMELGEHEAALNALRAVTLAKTEGPMSRAMAFLLQARIAYQRGEARRALLWARKAREVDPSLREADEFLRELGEA